MKKKGKLVQFFELIVTIAILAVLVETFLEELAVFMSWSRQFRNYLVIAGFAFDVFFTLEFLARLYWALSEKRATRYFIHERGWIDLVASIPLLVLNSGPAFLSLFSISFVSLAAGGIFNILKVIKAVRIARVLRFLRVIKIFRNIKYADSVMAQRHLARIATLIVTGMVLFIFSFTVLGNIVPLHGLQSSTRERWANNSAILAENMNDKILFEQRLKEIALSQKDLVRIQDAGGYVVYARFDDEKINVTYNPETDFEKIAAGELILTFDRTALNREDALLNMVWFTLVIFFIILIVIFYSPHFTMTISDPVIIMKKGFADPHYNLEVKIPKRLKEDEVFELADSYNQTYLPLKDRIQAKGEADTSVIKIEDIDFGRMERR